LNGGQPGGDLCHERRFVPLAAVRNRREIGRVGFGENRSAGAILAAARMDSARERHDSRERR
jgi:hypothetical protein